MNKIRTNNITQHENWNISLKSLLSNVENCKVPNKNNIDQDIKNKINNEDIHEINDKQKQNLSLFLNNIFGNREDDDSTETDDTEYGSVLLEEFPSRNRRETKTIFSNFFCKENSRRRNLCNIGGSFKNPDKSRFDVLDLTLRNGMANPSLDASNASLSSNISGQRVKHATIDSSQLKKFKKCTRPCLNSFSNLVREKAVDVKKFDENKWDISKYKPCLDFSGDDLSTNCSLC